MAEIHQLAVAMMPVAFALHNLEELRGFEGMRRLYYGRVPWLDARMDRGVFRTAVVALTIAVAAVFAWEWVWPSAGVEFLVGAIFCALLLNALQHLWVSVASGRQQPGVYTGTLLLLPLSGTAVLAEMLSRGRMLAVAELVAGAVLLPVAALAGIGLGLLRRQVWRPGR